MKLGPLSWLQNYPDQFWISDVLQAIHEGDFIVFACIVQVRWPGFFKVLDYTTLQVRACTQ